MRHESFRQSSEGRFLETGIMKPDRYEPWAGGRRRLSGFLQRHGANTGFSTWGGFLFGSPFVAAGIYIILIGTKLVAVNPASVHAPYWVLTAAGASFALGGLAVWGMAWQRLLADRRRAWAIREHVNDPALKDYNWHPEGFAASRWADPAKAVGLAVGVTVFLSIFNWWAFWTPAEWMVKGIVLLLDAIGLLMWWQAALKLGRAIKFGPARISFTRFPYRLNEPVIVQWRPSVNIRHVRGGSFTLRCVEEWMEWRGTGSQRSRNLIQEEVWSGTWLLERPRDFQVTDGVELRYDLPADARSTQLSVEKPVFWELEVKLDAPGLDFRETYLVPVYAPKQAEVEEGAGISRVTA